MEVIGVAKHDLRAQALQLVGRDALYSGQRPHWHEYRRLDDPMWQLKEASAGGAVRRALLDLEPRLTHRWPPKPPRARPASQLATARDTNCKRSIRFRCQPGHGYV